MQPENYPTNLKVIKAANVLYVGAVILYVCYSIYMQNGLCGFLMDLQLRLFGVALMGATAVSALGILMIPSVYISRYIKQQEILTTGKVSPDWRKTPLTSWSQVLIFGLAPAVIALAIYFQMRLKGGVNRRLPKGYNLFICV